MQIISSLALILWELLKKEHESLLSLIKLRQLFNPISAPKQKFKNLAGNFFCQKYEDFVCKISAL